LKEHLSYLSAKVAVKRVKRRMGVSVNCIVVDPDRMELAGECVDGEKTGERCWGAVR
jgi:hypothetical protein